MDSVVGPQRSSISAVEHAYGRKSGSVVVMEGSLHQRQSKRTTLINAAQWEEAEGAGKEEAAKTCTNETTSLVTADNAQHAPTTKTKFVAEIPAIIVTLMINFMTAIPFGVAYFPLGWSNDFVETTGTTGGNATAFDTETTDGIVAGPFPFPGKEILGIRMFLFSCLTGQLVLWWCSNFTSPVAVQLIENIPFYQTMAKIVVAHQGYGPDALSTLLVVFGLSSITTGLMFYAIGKAGFGKAVYYFPNHVLVGFIGGIGVFIAASSTGVMIGEEFTFTQEGVATLYAHFHEYAPVVYFEVVLRILMVVTQDQEGKPKFSLLAPMYFLSIIPIYYGVLYLWGMSLEEATQAGLFFPGAAASAVEDEASRSSLPSSLWARVFDGHILDLFRIIQVHTISWSAVLQCLGTILGVSCFSVINVPINIPAFANACDVEVDMNNELITHGYSNILSGIFGGIQNVMTYSISVLYYKSGGKSGTGQLALIVGTGLIFVFGMVSMPYIPRCMAGTLLLHIGIDLFLEGVYESYAEYDAIEYGGIVAITLVMTSMGMTPALVAGIVVAMTTYAMQSVQNLDPIFKITSATTLRSSKWTRPQKALEVLASPTKGRSQIMIIQLQGNIFFGNVVDAVDRIKLDLAKHKPVIVIIDFTLVTNMDSSAAQSINKLKTTMTQTFKTQTNIFVMGSHRGYFPTQYGLSTAILEEGSDEEEIVLKLIPKNQVCTGFDEALIFAEDMLITREDPSLLKKQVQFVHQHEAKEDGELDVREEKELAIHYVQNLLRRRYSGDGKSDATAFMSYFKREKYKKGDIVWMQGSASDSAKLVVVGEFTALMEGVDLTEAIPRGNFIGELGLIDDVERLSGVVCESDVGVVFSLDRPAWELLIEKDPAIARILDDITIRYLSHRVQHVSNRIYETRCLPV